MSDRSRRRAEQAQVSEILTSASTPEVTETVTETVRPKSIRALIMGMILAGAVTKDIAAQVKVHFPGTMADVKSTKHIAWYRSRMKKDGVFPVRVAETPTVDAEVPAGRAAFDRLS